jgi:cyclic pyranopterin phosphate synthase
MATDGAGRRIDYLRVSLTDRCNLRCTYCMDAEGIEWQPPESIATYEEIERFTGLALEEGISKVRLTGGEPLVRKGVVEHVARMAAIVGPDALALTTNGVLLAEYAEPLAQAGLGRVNVSLDTLDPEAYAKVTRGGDVARVLEGIDAAIAAGLAPLKLNVVVMSGLDQDLSAFAAMTLERPIHVRFIEYMPVGDVRRSGVWSDEQVVTSDQILERLAADGAAIATGPLEPVSASEAPGGWGPARYYRYEGASGTVGVISPLSHHFCDACNRLRLTADGRLRACLFCDEEADVRGVLQGGTDDDVREVIQGVLHAKPAAPPQRARTRRRMSQIGG